MKNISKESVRQRYASIAVTENSGCACSCNTAYTACCGDASDKPVAGSSADILGYSQEDIASLPEGAYLGLGCGNPQAIAELKTGEVVVDLGSGGGVDCFLAARQVGRAGKVIGIDMTAEMIEKARKNAEKGNYSNVEFLQGEMEDIPLEGSSADVVLSNCVINLSLDKQKVFLEIWRILKPGGRLAVSDIVTTAELPEAMKHDPLLHGACISGASPIDEVVHMMERAGFQDISVTPKDQSKEFIQDWLPGVKIEDLIVSADIKGKKPEEQAN